MRDRFKAQFRLNFEARPMLKHRIFEAGVVVALLLATFSGIGAQQKEIITSGIQLGFGARAIAMGGAYTSVGGDYSSSFWNPATLRDIKRVEVYGSLSHLARQNDFGLQDSTSFFTPFGRRNEENFTKFNDFGLAYPVPTIRGSLVLSFGFNRIKSYDSNFDFRTFNNTPDDRLNQAWRELERGSLNAWTLAGAVDVSPNVTFGVGLNFWTGGSNFESTFIEVDVDDVYRPEDGFDFNSQTIEETIDSEISGFNAKFGGVFRVGPMLRLGATISTPITFKVEEESSFIHGFEFDDGTFADEPPELTAPIYKIQSPWSFAGGASLHLLNIVFSGDVEYNDWSQIRYETEPPVDSTITTRARENRLFRDNYRATARVHLGAEFTLPLTGLSFRAGYFRDPSVFQDANPDEDKQFLSAGIGLLVDKQVRLDATYVHGFWKNFNDDLEDTLYEEDIKVNKVFVSLAFRF
ncbi:MAG: OmpP1/FadL family transporter [bacterium]